MSGTRFVSMIARGPIDITILICTHNRHALLGETLDSLADVTVPRNWNCEVLVVDNGSTDETRRVVGERVPTYPIALRYLYEPLPGKSNAMNAGIAASHAAVFACTDDDVRVGRDWLTAACAPLLSDTDRAFCYTGGPVRPIWDGPCPEWFPRGPSDLWGTIAILDYGSDRFVFEERRKVPLGANFAVRRDLFERIGGFVGALGRSTTRTLLGQELPELFRRARAVGAQGVYVPQMEVFHHVPGARLTPSYCRRWWYGKGVSRARVDRMHPLTELDLDLRATRHLAGVPQFMVGDAARDLWHWLGAAVRHDTAERIRLETRLCFFAGYAWDRQRERWRRDTAASRPPAIRVRPDTAGRVVRGTQSPSDPQACAS